MFWVICISVFVGIMVHTILDNIASHFNPLKEEFGDLKAKYMKRQNYTWRNSVVSFCHAFISGVWSLAALNIEPTLPVDLINTKSVFIVAEVSYSLGYFVFDSYHMLKWDYGRSTFELLVHHSVIFVCFTSALVAEKYVGYAVVSLLPEVNSVFLHLRRIMNYLRISKNNRNFKLVCLFNIGTFIVFRFVVLSWMTRWLVINRDQIPFGYYCLGSVGLAILMVMNIVLFLRIIYADFLTNSSVSGAVSLVSSAGNAVSSTNKINLSVNSSHIPGYQEHATLKTVL